MNEQWTLVDDYIADTVVASDDALERALEDSEKAGLPPISVTPAQGKLLFLLARMRGARTVLEIGTLGGYSTIWLGRAVAPEGRVITLEIDPHHADVARKNIDRAGLRTVVDIRLGRALDTIKTLSGPFDFFFIDADKQVIPDYFRAALQLSRSGSVIVVDNVVRKGELANASSEDENVRGVRRLHDLIAKEKRASATTIQTVGSKGYDGFTLAVVI